MRPSSFARLRGLVPALLLAFAAGSAHANPVTPEAVFRDATAAWHLADLQSIDQQSPFTLRGDVTLGVLLAGADREASLARGGDGRAARFDRGFLDAGQGGDNRLQLKGSALSALIRFLPDENLAGAELFAKHGGHTRTLFNLFSSRGDLGIEIGLADQPRLGGRIRFPLAQIPAGTWVDLIARYDGARLELFLNGDLVESIPATGPLRLNEEPLTLGRALRGHLVDHAALWSRALTDAEIAALSGRSSVTRAASAAPAPAATAAASGPDRVIGAFTGPDWGPWTATGEAFGSGPRDGVASSDHPSANTYGTLTSPEFVIDRRYLNFRLGGDARGTDMRLLVANRPVFTVRGDTPGELHPWSWDLTPYLGQTARVELRDFEQTRTRSRAHLLASDIRLSDTSALTTHETSLVLNQRFLNIPAAHSGRPGTFTLELDGQLFRTGGYIAPAAGQPHYWLSFDLGQHQGKTARILLSDVPPDAATTSLASVTAAPRDAATHYTERLRPQFHFSPRTGWLNDPNGMVYHNGEYHLFFQHNALGKVIANQSWGHAVSRDLFTWKELPVVLEPYSFSKGRSYSGSAVIDRQNRAGYGRDALIAIYTDTGGGAPAHGPEAEGQRAEVIAYSHDGGLTFTYPSDVNPVHRHRSNGRDPKVVWWPFSDHAQTDPNGHWVMVVYTVINEVNHAQILISPDLKTWTETDLVPDHYECVELYELPVLDADGRPTGVTKSILQGGNGTYNIGRFDGRKFHLDYPEKHQALMQPGYAYQRFNHAPDGRVVTIGWIRRHTDWEDMPFSQMMGLPLETTLRATPEGPRLHAAPVPEFDALRREIFRRDAFALEAEKPFALPATGQQLDLEVTFRPVPGQPFVIELGADRLEWADGRLNRNPRHLVPVAADGTVTLRAIIDRPLVEVFGNHGSIYVPLARKDQGKDVTPTLSGAGSIVSLRLAEVASTVAR